MQGQFWIDSVGQIIIVRAKGKTSVTAVRERHARIIQLSQKTGCKKILFDFLEAEAPSYEVKAIQQQLNIELKALNFRIAIVVPNFLLAYHGRIAFGDDNHRIVYEDLTEAVSWLNTENDAAPLTIDTIKNPLQQRFKS